MILPIPLLKEKTMLNKSIIKEVIAQLEDSSFIEQFKKLRDHANVEYYEVDLKEAIKTYTGPHHDVFVDKLNLPSMNFSHTFDETRIKTVLNRRRDRKTTYIEFLQEIAEAGVTHYKVDMKKNHVIYYGDSQEYTELIPPHLLK
jgi:uncharacterized protein YbcV (DUF1398 family)